MAARDACVNAAYAYGDTTSNAADEARFFSGLSRVFALGFNVQSDGNPNNGLNTLGDILDAFGCAISRDPLDLKPECPSVFPPSAPSGSDLQAFTANVIQPELEGAIQNLGKVSTSFTLKWTEPFGHKLVTSDYGDVLTLKAVSEFLLGSVLVENSYNLNANLANNYTQEGLLAANPNFLRLGNTSGLHTAQSQVGNALGDTVSAINLIRSRSGDPNSYLISLTMTSFTDINDLIRHLNLLKASLTAPTNITDKHGVQNFTLDLSIFFAGVDARNLLPQFSGNRQSGPFPDPTFSGIWTNYVPGAEFDPNRDWTTQHAASMNHKTKGHNRNTLKSAVR